MLGFNSKKTIAAAAYLLKKAPGKRMNYMRLLKLLYLADRKSLKERKSPICGGTVFAMPQGPVISQVLHMIKGEDPQSDEWEEFIEKLGFDVELSGHGPGVAELSRAELQILDEVAGEYRDLDEWELVKWCHENLAEFIKNDPERLGKKRQQIPLSDVMVAVGEPGAEQQVLANMNQSLHFSKLFGDHSFAEG